MQRAIQHVPSRYDTAASRPRIALRCLLSAVLAVAAGLASLRAEAHPVRVRPPAIVVGVPPGTLSTVLNDVLWRPFIRNTHQRVTAVIWDGTLSTLRQKPGAARHNWSLLLVEDEVAQAGCRDGVFLASEAVASAAQDSTACYSAGPSLDFALAWDTSRFHGTPNWADFWDVARHPGKRGLRADPRSTLEVALLSDGVPPDAVYRVLSTPEGLDHAFRRLNQLRPYIVWWTTSTEAIRILTTGAALMGMAATVDVLATNAASPNPGFGLLPSPLFRVNYDWVIPSDTARGIAAARGLRTWATAPEQKNALTLRLSGTQDGEMAQIIRTGPGIPHFLPPLPLNNAFWHDHLPAIEERFRQWMSEH